MREDIREIKLVVYLVTPPKVITHRTTDVLHRVCTVIGHYCLSAKAFFSGIPSLLTSISGAFH